MAKTGLFILRARNAHRAVIFRRGPSKQVLLIKWDLKNDSFEIGQWFKGRIYERRCDLSPSGDLLIYFAAKHKKPLYCWTAISKPPYLTALALWPKKLGAWGGGGLFESEDTILLNHQVGERDLDEGFQLKKNMKTRPLGEHSGRGEDSPIYHVRLLRDGWTLKQVGKHTNYQRNEAVRWAYTESQVYEKRHIRKKKPLFLQMQLRGIGEQQGDWYVLDYEILDEKGNSLLKLPRTSWADWDSNGDLLFAERGKLFRLPWTNLPDIDRKKATEIADFSLLKFAPKEAPQRAKRW